MYVPRTGRKPAPKTDETYGQRRGVFGARTGLIVLTSQKDHLLVFAEKCARARGLHELRLYTNTKMTENLDYYPRQGFHIVDRKYEDGSDRVQRVRAFPH